MFTIVITEKGGGERRETFDKTEINVGRVQGNDLMLPKGNVSKHHARLLYRDGRFIVTDLKSTNGTYVNGRKISQATIIREGDKVYVGDFILRLDAPEGAIADDDAGVEEVDGQSVPGLEAAPPFQPGFPQPVAPVAVMPVTPGTPLHVGPQGPAPGAPPAAYGAPPPPAAYGSTAPAPYGPPGPGAGGPPIATLKAGTQPPPRPSPADDGAPARRPMTIPPAPQPRVATGPLAASAPPGPLPGAQPSVPPRAEPAAPRVAPPQAASPGPAARAQATPGPSPAKAAASGPRVPPPLSSAASGPGAKAPASEAAGVAGRRLALLTLVDRVAGQIDLSPLDASPFVGDQFARQVERVARDQAQALARARELPDGVSVDDVITDATRELVGLGCLVGWLEDESVEEIHATRFDQVVCVREDGVEPSVVGFSSDDALRRVLVRLVSQSGQPWLESEVTLERRVPQLGTLTAVAPPAATFHGLSIRRPRRVEATFESLAAAGVMSKPLVAFFEGALAARANLLVCGPLGIDLVAAFAAHADEGDRVALVHDGDAPVVPRALHVSLQVGDSDADAQGVAALGALRSDQLLVTSASAPVAARLVGALLEGASGVVLATTAPTLRQGFARLVGQLMLERPGVPLDGARDIVGEAFDLAVELVSVEGGKMRVARVAELTGSDAKGIVARDVFVFADSADGGSFNPTGVVPRFVAELASRGVKLDPATFKRGSK